MNLLLERSTSGHLKKIDTNRTGSHHSHSNRKIRGNPTILATKTHGFPAPIRKGCGSFCRIVNPYSRGGSTLTGLIVQQILHHVNIIPHKYPILFALKSIKY